jgi:hypothetical protein
MVRAGCGGEKHGTVPWSRSKAANTRYRKEDLSRSRQRQERDGSARRRTAVDDPVLEGWGVLAGSQAEEEHNLEKEAKVDSSRRQRPNSTETLKPPPSQ